VQGGFSERLVVPAGQVVPIPAGLAPALAVLAEPLAVALHAVHRAGPVFGRRVLVTGAGPIGCVVVAARSAAGAAEVLATDLVPEPLRIAGQVGATHTFLAGTEAPAAATAPDATAPDATDVDVAIEASGSPAALVTAAGAVRRGGRLVMLGLLPPGTVPYPGNLVVTRELDVRGAFRFDPEFGEALRLLAGGLPVGPVVTGTVGLAGALSAFELAADRRRACKVLLDLTG
jgi:L-idonate 5-dehydrogenase